MTAARLRRALALSAAEQRLAVEALIVLAFCRAVLALLPFRIAMRWLGLRLTERIAIAGEREAQMPPSPAADIGQALLRASSIAPFRAVCLQQALAAALMLRWRGQQVEVYFGLAKDSTGSLIAHAWSKSQGGVVTGGQQMPDYTPISVFVT